MIELRNLGALGALLLASAAVSAQAGPATFRWQPGQVLTYRVTQLTTETEIVGGTKAESSLNLQHVKRWQVLAVDAVGVATVQQSLTALRIERKMPTGATAFFDSAQPEKSDPELREQLSKYVGTPLATLRIDSRGKVIEVKESKHAPPSRYENELPFALVLPAEGLRQGQAWDRPYTLTLDPPLGTGEKYAAEQKYLCKEMAGPIVTIVFKTLLKGTPQDKGDQAKLLQFLPDGEAVFDLRLGCLRRSRLVVNQEMKGHQGEDSSYQIQSSYLEEYVGDN
jgi:hypothetical protein